VKNDDADTASTGKEKDQRENMKIPRKFKKLMFWSGAVLFLIIFVGFGIRFWHLHDIPALNHKATVNRDDGPLKSDVFNTGRKSVESSISLTGNIEPKKVINICSPAAAKVREIFVRHGQVINAGDPMVRFDLSEIEVKHRESLSAHIKTKEKLEEVLRWRAGPEVVKAKRAVLKAETALAKQKKRTEDTERLYQKGIVSGSEMDNENDQLANREMELVSANEELKGILAKGGQNALLIAEYDEKNARAKLEEVERQLKDPVIKAPVSGIVMAPVTSDSKEAKKYISGSTVALGEAMFALGDLTGINVVTKVNEVEVTKVRPGLPVKVTGDAFPEAVLQGRISAVSSQARKQEQGSAATFDLVVTVDNIPDNIRKKVLVGMSAMLEIQIYSSDNAVMVPVKAVYQEKGRYYVNKKIRGTDRTEKVEVKPGVTTADDVEILEGLKPGDEVVGK
jgi:multidrug efflux pump subunit AcrA (membrane-fusion protein)